MKHLFLVILIFSCSLSAKDIFVRDSIELRKFYLEVYPSLFGSPDYALEKDFKKLYRSLSKGEQRKINQFLKNIDPLLPSEFLRPLIYWRYIKKDRVQVENVLNYIFTHKLMSLRDYISDPKSQNPLWALKLMRDLSDDQDLLSDRFFTLLKKDLKDKAELIASIEGEKIFIQALEETKLINTNIKENISDFKGYVLDPFGIIPGNKIELLSFNDTSADRIDWVNANSIFNGGKLDFSLPFMNINTHPAFTEDEIFIRMKEMVLRAKESIFIDIFLFGGTMGGTFAKFLVDEALKKDEGFKLLILHDYATNYNMKDEMMPIFEYLKNRIQADPKVKQRVFLLQANIQRHPPGVPFNLTGLIPKTDEVFKEIEKRNTYFESKIDHSKVIIVDANSSSPEAYLGSKNWTDHSGAYYFDNTLWIKGPSAALIQSSYVEDIEAALTEDPKEQSWFFYKEEGYDNKAYLDQKNEIIDFFKIKRDHYPAMGPSSLRIAEANVDGKIRNVRNTLIDLIQSSYKNIFMEQLFLYDPYIVDALILKKMNEPEIEINVIIDHNGNFGFNGFPNTIFLRQLIEAGIKIKTRKTIGVTAIFINGKSQTYHQENHRKITSFDGEILLVGSSNINPDTLQGSFREIGAVVYDKKEARKYEAQFRSVWNNREQAELMNIEEYQMKLGQNFVDKVWSSIINDLAGTLMRSKDSIERRY